MTKKDAAKREAKKHEKEKKRKKKLVARGGELTRRDPVDAWRPAAEGIEGLAHRMKTGSHDAAYLADLVAKHGRRADARTTWLPSRVRALTDAQILAELAARGVVTDKPRFVAAAEANEGARDMAFALWKPKMLPDATVHDRDFLGEASVALWARWLPHHVSDEALHDRLRAAFDHLDDGAEAKALDALLAAWALARDHGGIPRIERVDSYGECFLGTLLDLLFYESRNRTAEALAGDFATLREIRESLPADHDQLAEVVLGEAGVLQVLDRREEAIELLLALAPTCPLDPFLLGEAVAVFAENPGMARAIGEELLDALSAAAAAADRPLADTFQVDIECLTLALADR